jgi:hypothetical protein
MRPTHGMGARMSLVDAPMRQRDARISLARARASETRAGMSVMDAPNPWDGCTNEPRRCTDEAERCTNTASGVRIRRGALPSERPLDRAGRQTDASHQRSALDVGMAAKAAGPDKVAAAMVAFNLTQVRATVGRSLRRRPALWPREVFQGRAWGRRSFRRPPVFRRGASSTTFPRSPTIGPRAEPR